MRNRIFVLFLFITSLTYSQGYEKNFIDLNYIEVTGKSEMEVTPDEIYIKVLIDEKDTKNKTSVSELEQSMVKKLKEIGIDVSKDLLIKDIASNFKNYLLSRNEVLLSKEYQILAHDGKTTAQVFLELEKIGISNVSIEKLDHSKLQQYRKEVKIEAVKAAKDKAEALANAIGQDIGRAIYIQEFENNFGYKQMLSNTVLVRRSEVYGSSAPELELDFEKIKLEYSILCRFELK